MVGEASGGPLNPEGQTPQTVVPPKEGEQTAEQTDKQKIYALVNQVREVNAQLGGKMAAEVEFASGRSTIFFARTSQLSRTSPITDPRQFVFGVDSMRGPVYVSGKLSTRLLQGASHSRGIDLKQVPSVTETEVEDWVHRVMGGSKLDAWGKAFEDSKNAVLQDQQEMQRVKELSSRELDKALAVVSKPVDINAPSSPTATESLATPPPTALA